MSNSLLIIGHPKSGKTTFLAQFFTRIKKRKSDITLSKMPENIKAITNAVNRLASGQEPLTTPADENVQLVLPIEVEGKSLDLICPDYGGEQVNDLTGLMEIGDNWKELVSSSDCWMLFIRADKIPHEYDLSISSYEEVNVEKSSVSSSHELSEQSKFIELLQLLLHAKKAGIRQDILSPKVSIVLSCWDELKTEELPSEILAKKLPLLHHFLKTVWDNDAIRILGLSAQEFPLDTDEAKDKYKEQLPENFGYMVDDKGKKDKDITKLVKLALQ